MHSVSVLRLLAFGLSLCSTTQAVTLDRRASNTSTSDVQTYFNIDGASHTKKAKDLTANGYQIISLSTYGEPSKARYASIWVRRDGSPPELIHNANKVQYDAWLDEWRMKGYVSTQVSATGPADKAVFAGVMEKSDVANWEQSCGLDSPWGVENGTQLSQAIVKGFRMYGTPENRQYCILRHENEGNQLSTIHYSTNYTIDYPAIFKSETSKRFWRPARLFVSESHITTPQFVDTDVGKWVAKDSLTAKQLKQEIKTQKKQGLFPIDLQGGGSGDKARFNVIFAEKNVPSERQWRATGTVKGFKDDAGAKTGLDAVMQAWMKKNGVRQAQVAFANGGQILTERSFTWAESNRATVEPDDVFLLASVSKMFVHAAIYNLAQNGQLNYSDPVYTLLGYEPTDARANNVTIQHLLDHTGGYNRDISGDPGFMFRQVAMAQSNGERPATLRDVIEYMVARPLDSAPGERYSYSNYGSMLLSYVVSNITNTPYLEYLEKNILNGLDVRLYETAAEKHANDRIVQESQFTGYDPMRPKSNDMVPGPHGGDNAIKEETMGAFSLAASATTIARFIGNHSVFSTGGRSVYSSRDGTTVGARTFAESRPEVDWAFTLNTREYISETEFDDLRYFKIPFFLEDYPILVEN